jgi:alkylhydroperoxidase family enzyme
MDLNAAGLLREANGHKKLEAVESWRSSTLFSNLERAALAYAEAVTRSDSDVDDELFGVLRRAFDESELVLLTGWICLENFYSKFNRAFRIDAQGFCLVPRAVPDGEESDSIEATTSPE